MIDSGFFSSWGSPDDFPELGTLPFAQVFIEEMIAFESLIAADFD